MNQKTTLFPFGTIFNLDETRSLVWEKEQLDAIQAAGFSFVSLYPAAFWKINGKKATLDFSRQDALLAHAEKLGLFTRVSLTRPNGIGNFLPDFDLGEEALVQGTSLPDLFQPQVQKALLNTLQQISKHYARQKSLQAIELHLLPLSPPALTPLLLPDFRNFLKKRYLRIETLNRAWSSIYRNFGEIRRLPVADRSPVGFADYRAFLRERCQNVMKTAVQVVEKNGRMPLLVTVREPHPEDQMADRLCRMFAVTRAGGCQGVALYEQQTQVPWAEKRKLLGALSAAGGKPLSLTALGLGPENATPAGKRLDTQTLRYLTQVAIAYGVDSIALDAWQTGGKGARQGRPGLIQSDGSPDPLLASAQELIAEIRKLPAPIGRGTPLKPKIALLASSDAIDLCHLESACRPGAKLPENPALKSLVGWARILLDQRFDFAVVDRQGVEEGALENFRILLMPLLPAVTVNFSKALHRFVSSGGGVVSEARCGLFDLSEERYDTRPGADLNHLFGLRTEGLYPEAGDGLMEAMGSLVRCGGVQEIIIPGPGACIQGHFRNNRAPAFVQNDFGHGAAYYFGTNLGQAYLETRDENIPHLVFPLIERFCLPYLATVSREASLLDLRIHEIDSGYIVYLINHFNIETEETLRLNIGNIQSVLDLRREKKIRLNKENELTVHMKAQEVIPLLVSIE